MTAPDEVQTYGPFVAECSGTGQFVLAGNQMSENGPFWIGQAHNGNVLICYKDGILSPIELQSDLTSFSGVTDSGFQVATIGKLYPMRQHLDFLDQSRCTIVLASEVHLATLSPSTAVRERYGLTNFLYCGTEQLQVEPNHWQLALPLTIRYENQSIAGKIHMLPDYDSASRLLEAVRGIRVTVELEIDMTASEMSVSNLDTAVDTLCRVLSLARGTHVTWVYRTSVNADGRPVGAVYSNRPTFGYHSGAILDDSPNDATNTRQFVEETCSEYIAKSSPYMLDKGSLDTYLEGKAEGQYLETRALKLVVAMEMLVAGHFHDPAAARSDHVINPSVFSAMVPELTSCISQTVLSYTANHPSDRKHAKRISAPARVSQLNERSFEELVYVMWQDIGLRASPADARSIQVTRNSLVHTGQFACSRVQETPNHVEACQSSTPIEEYFSLSSLLDRTFLRILNYDGPYIDWRVPSHPQRRLHVND